MDHGEQQQQPEQWQQHPEYKGVYAMTHRSMQETNLREQFLADCIGEDPNPASLRLKELLVGPLTIHQLQVLEGATDDDFRGFISAAMEALDNDGLRSAYKLDDATDEELDAIRAYTHEATADIMNTIDGLMQPGQKPAGSATYEGAKALAAARDVSTAEVFENDDLYAELVRSQDTPDEFMTKVLDGLEVFTPEVFAGIATQAMESIVNNLTDPEDIEDYREELAELLASEEFEQDTIQVSHDVKLYMAHYNLQLLERFWGRHATDSLSEATLQRIYSLDSPEQKPEQQIGVVEVGGMTVLGVDAEQAAFLQARERVVHEYAAQKGWDVDDPANLTVEQILEIRSLPEWQNPPRD